MTEPTLREQALRDAYWAHREVPGRHRGECCQDPCFADITERWVALVTERAALTEARTTTDARLRAIFPLAPWSSPHTEAVVSSQLRAAAQAIVDAADDPDTYVNMPGGLLDELRAALGGSDQCGVLLGKGPAACDRPRGHEGYHEWAEAFGGPVRTCQFIPVCSDCGKQIVLDDEGDYVHIDDAP